MTDRAKNRVAGALSGFGNGVFGGGGGMVLLPLLTRWGKQEPRRAFATCVAVILPMCCVSAAVYLWRLRPPLWVLLLSCALLIARRRTCLLPAALGVMGIWLSYLLGPCTLPRYALPLFCLAPPLLAGAFLPARKEAK